MRQTPRPEWLTAIVAAKKRVFEALPPEERDLALQMLLERRRRAQAKRAEALSLATRIFALYDSGHTAAEISEVIGMHPGSIQRAAARRGVSISSSVHVSRRAVAISRDRELALRRLAVDYGTSSTRTLTDLLIFALDDDAAIARRVMHVKRKNPS